MSIAPSRSKPLVYASRAAIEQARRVMPGRVLENAVQEAILAGNVVGGHRTGRVRGDGWEASVVRTEGKFRARPRAWLVTGVTAAKRLRRM